MIWSEFLDPHAHVENKKNLTSHFLMLLASEFNVCLGFLVNYISCTPVGDNYWSCLLPFTVVSLVLNKSNIVNSLHFYLSQGLQESVSVSG